ncbi:MAG: hypothetical protein HQM10_09285 [Candidatus Riflebacteria bacterium]|nr:hypothetical protein [Candidatus Riflebacteria bacterium]
MKNVKFIFLFAFVIFLNSSSILFAEAALEFYYQQILEVRTDLATPTTPISIIRYNAEMAKEQYNFRINPTEGEKIIRSPTNKNVSYRVNRVKVKDEEQLLELMSAKGDESKLTNGQKGLLASYRYSSSAAAKERLKLSDRKVIKTVLSDTTGFEDSSKYPNLERDFWPMSLGKSFQLSSKYFDSPDFESIAKSNLIHELSHTLDKNLPMGFAEEAITNFFKDGTFVYGKDGMHSYGDITTPRVAFMEGWSWFNQMIEFRKDRDLVFSSIKTLSKENPKTGDITYYSATDSAILGSDLLNCEGVNAKILYRLANEVANGRDKVNKAFLASNSKNHTFRSFIKKFIEQNLGDLERVRKILDEETHGKLSRDELNDLLRYTPPVVPGPVALPPTTEVPQPPTQTTSPTTTPTACPTAVPTSVPAESRVIQNHSEQRSPEELLPGYIDAD